MPSALHVAVVGAGTMAQSVHLPVLRRRWDRFSVAAIVDISPRRLREASEVWGVAEDRRYETVADLVKAVRAHEIEVDAAVVSSDGLHTQDVLALIRRGIHVLVEPPLGFSEAEVREVADFERMTGRRLVMLAHPQQYDPMVKLLAERLPRRDLRLLDHEVRMPAAQAIFGQAHVTVSAYDLPSELRAERRKSLEAAVIAGTGEAAVQRDRDMYVKGLLTGISHQLAVLETVYGPIDRIEAVRQWPAGVIPGSIEVLARLEGHAPVRLVWHYLPFAPEYTETITAISARRRLHLELPAPSLGDERSTLSLRERVSGTVQETTERAVTGSAEAMWEAFHAFVVGGGEPAMGAEEAARQTVLLRELLEAILVADGRTLDPEVDTAPEDGEAPEPEPEADAAPEDEDAQVAGPVSDGDGETAETEVDADADADAVTADGAASAPDAAAPIAAPASAAASAPADPVAEAPVADAWSTGAPADSPTDAPRPDDTHVEGTRSD